MSFIRRLRCGSGASARPDRHAATDDAGTRTESKGEVIFNALRENTLALQENAAKNNNTKATQLIESIADSTSVLDREWGKTPTPESFFESLALNAKLLKEIRKKDLSKDKNFEALQDVADDLRVKAAHCEAVGWASKVKVTVNTKRNDGTIVPHQEVFFVSVGMARNRNSWKRFSKLSSPTNEEPLNPGVWMMRIKNGENVKLEIGEGSTQSVDLIVP